MFQYVADAIEVKRTVVPTSITTSSTAVNGTGVDLSNYDAAVLVYVDAPQFGAGSAVFTVEDSEDNSTFAAVAAAALVNPNTGVADTFTSVTTSSGSIEETLALKKEVLKRYVRVVVTPTGGTGVFTAQIIAHKRNY